MMEAVTKLSSGEQSREEPSRTIVHRIADLEGVDPTELTPPLYSVIDPDALDSLFHSPTIGESQTSGHVRFTYCSYEVHVRSDGRVSISEA